jgi:hypothetical protein
MKRLIAGMLLVATLSIASSVYAHHAAAGIDRTKTVTIEGVVKQFKWANPHSWMELEVRNANGNVDVWNLEMTSPAFLVRAGWKSSTLKAGDKVTAVARPFKNGDPGGLFVSITLADGRKLSEQATPAAPAAPAPVR